jgi:hypothetical protein
VEQFDAVLVHLKSYGALLNAVKAEMLLDEEDLKRVMAAREARAKGPEELASLEAWESLQMNYDQVSIRAWNALLTQVCRLLQVADGTRDLQGCHGRPNQHQNKAMSTVESTLAGMAIMPTTSTLFVQVLKIFMLSRITTKAMRALPGSAGLDLPPDATMTGSNLYSIAEGVLLAWLGAHTKAVSAHSLFPQHLAQTHGNTYSVV